MLTGTGRKLTHVVPDKEVNCEVNSNDYGVTHYEEGPGCKGINPFIENAGAGKIELEVPIYVLFSRERGLYEGPRIIARRHVPRLRRRWRRRINGNAYWRARWGYSVFRKPVKICILIFMQNMHSRGADK